MSNVRNFKKKEKNICSLGMVTGDTLFVLLLSKAFGFFVSAHLASDASMVRESRVNLSQNAKIPCPCTPKCTHFK